MILKVVLGLISVLILLAVYAWFKTPTSYPISRSILIGAPPAAVYPHISNSKLIQEWNPFGEGDPTLKLEYSGPDSGVGAQYAWEGAKAGKGKATIIEVETNRRVGLRLEFKKPFDVTNYGDYVLQEKSGGTELTWTIIETATIPRVISVFFNLDRMVGSMFEKGLLKVKDLVEKKVP